MSDNIVTFPNEDEDALNEMKALIDSHEFMLVTVTEDGISLGFSKYMTPSVAHCVLEEAKNVLTSAGVMELFHNIAEHQEETDGEVH